MKYLISLLLGLLVGAALFAVGVIYNPLFSQRALSPLSVTDSQTVTLGYSAVANDSIIYSNDGESRISPHPEKVLQLWEASIRQTSAMATVLLNGRSQTAGVGIKFASLSESTRLMAGQALVDSVWYVYLPGRGALFIEQTENYWSYVRDIVVPAYRGSANTWAGAWLGNVTSGPGALGTAKVTGSSGEFDGLETMGVETLSMRAWRADGGPLAADGRIIIELPSDTSAEAYEDEDEEIAEVDE
jgi:hypothetical protein